MKVKSQKKSGFTLVEMIVALAVFMIVAVVAVGALLKITDANRKAQTLQTAINNINFAFESMTREMRVGQSYYCYSGNAYVGTLNGTTDTTPCPSGVASPSNGGIAFLSSNTVPNGTGGSCSLTYSYYFAPNTTVSNAWTIEKAQEASSDCGGGLSAPQYAPIIDPSVIITSYNFFVVGSPTVQPKIFLHIVGYAGQTDSERTYFNLQTTISERV